MRISKKVKLGLSQSLIRLHVEPFMYLYVLFRNLDSSFGVARDYGLDDRGSIPHQGQVIFRFP
jgi:hypothetical protein